MTLSELSTFLLSLTSKELARPACIYTDDGEFALTVAVTHDGIVMFMFDHTGVEDGTETV